MKKLLAALALALLTLSCVPAGATELQPYDGPAWTFEVPLSQLADEAFWAPASPLDPLTAADEPAELVTVESRRNGDDGENLNGGVRKAANVSMQLRPEAYDALVKLFTAAENAGVQLYIRQGYRSYEDQAQRYEAAQLRGETDVPKPGETDYQTGLAVTVVGREDRAGSLTAEAYILTEEYQYLAANMARFGFVVRYPELKSDVTGGAFEPWHLRYVGQEAAEYMTRTGACLEELLQAMEEAEADFLARGGDVEAALQAEVLPEGPVLLLETGPDGDRELTIFHD